MSVLIQFPQPVSKACGVFSNRVLPSTSGKQPWATGVAYNSKGGCPMPGTEDFLSLWNLEETFCSSSGITSFKLSI